MSTTTTSPVCAGMLKFPMQFMPIVYRPNGDDGPKPIRVYPGYEALDPRWSNAVRVDNRDDLSEAIGILIETQHDASYPLMKDTDLKQMLLIALPVPLAQELFALKPEDFARG